MAIKQIGTIVLVTLFIQNSWGQQSCPLTNSKLTDLRTAAAKLATTVNLSAECKAYEDTVNQSNTELVNIANQISTINGTTVDPNSSDPAALAMKAVTQLNTVNSVFNNKSCGQQLAGFMDYAGAFIDVATGIAPFLAIYGGPEAMPWVLGSALGGAAVKSIITFFKGKSVDMRNPDQSNAFIKNSCSFYNLDLIKNSIDDLQLNQSTQLEKEIVNARESLKDLERNAPEEPSSDLSDKLKLAEKDSTRIEYLQDQFKVDPIEACTYIQAYAAQQDGAQDDNLIDRVWSNYQETIKDKAFRLELEKNYYYQDLNHSITIIEPEKCKDLGQRWLTKISNLSQTGILKLREVVGKEPSVKQYQDWVAQKNKITESIKVLEAKQKFFQEMTGSGFNIEYSEIIRSHQQVQDALFDSYRYMVLVKMRGLADAWLKVKQEDANIEYKNFFSRKKDVEERIKEIKKTIGIKDQLTSMAVNQFANNYFIQNHREHNEVHKNVLTDVCNQLRLTWSAWYNGLIHAKAGKDYCVTFDKVINKLDYPDVQKMCFGTTSRSGHRLTSLKNQVRDFNNLKPEADKIVEKMKSLSCQENGEFNQTIMSQPLT